MSKELKRTNLNWYALEDLTILEGFNLREDYGDIESFALWIVENGTTFPPMRVFNEAGTTYITEGHRRYKACCRAVELGADLSGGIPCILEPKTSNREDQIARQISSNEGKGYTPLEKALVVKKLDSVGWTAKQIADKTGMSLPTVYNLTHLAKASQATINLIKDNKISSKTAIDLIKEHGSDKAHKKIVEALQGPSEANDKPSPSYGISAFVKGEEPSKQDDAKKDARKKLTTADIKEKTTPKSEREMTFKQALEACLDETVEITEKKVTIEMTREQYDKVYKVLYKC